MFPKCSFGQTPQTMKNLWAPKAGEVGGGEGGVDCKLQCAEGGRKAVKGGGYWDPEAERQRGREDEGRRGRAAETKRGTATECR